MKNLELIENLRENLPPSIAGIGYGSGIFYQKGYSKAEKPDKDVILIVENLHSFLTEDYQMHPEHFYKGAEKKYGKLEAKDASWFYNKIGCLKFEHEDSKIKLLIVEKDALLYDLFTWQHFNLAGRLSKPIIYDNMPKQIDEAIKENRTNILIVSLLMANKEELTREELYKIISGLSYNGDIRMVTDFEKKTKALDIVDGSFEMFEEIYGDNPLLTYDGDKIINPYPVEYIKRLPSDFYQDFADKINSSKFKWLSEEEKKAEIQKIISDIFFRKNLVNSLCLLYSCEKTLGVKTAIKHALTKKIKAKVKTRK